MKRCVELVPGLTNGKGVEALSIVRHGVGLRPVRIGGVRLEKEEIGHVWTVHNYGHGGFGCKLKILCICLDGEWKPDSVFRILIDRL
jgi:hypothetical protein